MRKILQRITNALVAVMQGTESFALMAILNAFVGILCALTGWWVSTLTFGIFGLIWGLIALAVAIQKQRKNSKSIPAGAGETKAS